MRVKSPSIDTVSDAVLNSDCQLVSHASTGEAHAKITQSGKTRKHHLANDFKMKLDELKRKYLSSDVVQIDPLYDALKLYQQDLVRQNK